MQAGSPLLTYLTELCRLSASLTCELSVVQQLLSQTEKKMKECQPEKRRKGKKILIEEVQEDDEEPSVKQTGEIV